jgi:hypothetical protein
LHSKNKRNTEYPCDPQETPNGVYEGNLSRVLSFSQRCAKVHVISLANLSLPMPRALGE